MIRSVFNMAVLVGSVVYWGTALLLVWLFTRSTEKCYGVVTAWGRNLTHLTGVVVRSVNRDRVDFTRAYLVMSNHRSHADIPVLLTAIPAPVSFVAKKELKHIPFMGWAMQIVGMIFIDRRNPTAAIESMKDAGRLIEQGTNILIFPEGTRSEDGKSMRPLKKGGFHMALESGAPILPVAVSGTEKVMSKYDFAIHPGCAEVRFGEPIFLRPDDDVESLRKRVETEMRRLASD